MGIGPTFRNENWSPGATNVVVLVRVVVIRLRSAKGFHFITDRRQTFSTMPCRDLITNLVAISYI